MFVFSSESVGEGHPDKVADFISDSILDACLTQDPDSRVACETLVKDNHCVIAGEITTKAVVDYELIVRKAVENIGYRAPEDDPVFNAKTLKFTNLLSTQSPDIAQGVDAREAEGKEGSEQGAGDQGIMFGYACDETPELMPAPVMYAHKIMRELARIRHEGKVSWLRPDSKSQVAVEYGNDGTLKRIVNVVLSTQHTEGVSNTTIREFCKSLILSVLPDELVDGNTEFFINPTGRFVIGGPQGDSGLTGRKIIVDTYGGMGRHGGGAFSGKDCSKVDRSGAYMCRWVAKHIVAAGLAKKCEVQVSYAIGKADPLSIYVNTFGTSVISEGVIADAVKGLFSFKPADIIEDLQLKQPLYTKTTNYGHFTKPDLPWETLNPSKVSELKNLALSEGGKVS